MGLDKGLHFWAEPDLQPNGNSAMNYDSWKLVEGSSYRDEILADRCSDVESFLHRKLTQAAEQANVGIDGEWEPEEIIAEADDDGNINVELNLRLRHIPADGKLADLKVLAEAFSRVAESLSRLAEANASVTNQRIAPSVQNQVSERRAEIG